MKQSPRRLHVVYEYLERQTWQALVVQGAVLVLLVGALDLATGPDLSFYVFYFVPILLVTAYGGVSAGVAISVVGAAVWSAADQLSGAVYAAAYVRYWNLFVRFLSFLLVATMQHLLGRERYLARTDFLTKLANRQYFYEVAEKEISRSRRYQLPLTAAYIDLDNFKQVNDRFGHMAGNRLLRVVSTILAKNIRDVDTAARLGGDEFGIILPQTEQQAGLSVLQKLQALLNEAMRANAWPVTFSIGAVTFVRPPGSVKEMITAIDSRMYAVKGGGKNGLQVDVME